MMGKIFDYQGSMGRASFLYCWIVILMLILVNYIIASLGGTQTQGISWLLTLISWCIGWCSMIKRLHDIDKSGWWSLLSLVPLVNIGLMIYLCFAKGKEGMEQKWREKPFGEKRVKIRRKEK